MDSKLNKHVAPRRFSSDADLYPFASHHRDAIESLYVIDPAYVHQKLARLTAEKTVIFVCFSNRSGSNLLLDALDRVGFGCAAGDEFLNAEAINDHAQKFTFERFEDYLEFIIRMRSIRRHVFLKIGPHQLFWMANTGLLGKYFKGARYILVERADRVAQAVSLYIADESKTYLRSADSEAAARPKIEYSAEAILRRLKHIADVTSLFEYFFHLHSLPYHRILYEDLDADPVCTVKRLAAALSVNDDLPLRWESTLKRTPAGILRQANALNSEFAERFRGEFAIGDSAELVAFNARSNAHV